MRFAILAVLATSCSGPQRRVCTLEFRTISVRVVDGAGQPVDHLETRTVFARTGEVVPVQRGYSLGSYAIADDGHAGELADADGEVFRFEIMVDPPVTRDFVLRLDGCHIDAEHYLEPIVLAR